MMRTLRFRIEEHEKYGSLGLRPTWIPNAEPAQSMQSAHDVMEHPPTGPDGIDTTNELRALGAMLYIRGLGGWFSRSARYPLQADPGYQLSGDIERFVTDWQWDLCPPAPPTRPSRDYGDEVESWMDKAISTGLRTARDEMEAYDRDEILPRLAAIRDHARGWLRVGFMDARRRYRNRDSLTLSHWFSSLQGELAEALDGAEEGAEVLLRYSHTDGPGRAYVVDRYEPEHSEYEPWDDD